MLFAWNSYRFSLVVLVVWVDCILSSHEFIYDIMLMPVGPYAYSLNAGNTYNRTEGAGAFRLFILQAQA